VTLAVGPAFARALTPWNERNECTFASPNHLQEAWVKSGAFASRQSVSLTVNRGHVP
jgi:hypothetical protein